MRTIEIHMLREGEPGWTGEPYGWWAKGDYRPNEFCAAAAHEPIDGRVPEQHEVERQWWRFVPWGRGEHGGRYEQAGFDKTGAFLVTVVDLDQLAWKAAA